MTEWFEQWFGEEYLHLYPHRDDKDALDLVDLIQDSVKLQGAKVLDLACGPGRHGVHLENAGADVVGFDLSLPLLSRARHGAGLKRLVRGDMRWLPFAPASFDLVTNLFTSFGYFEKDEQHALLVRAIGDSLVNGGVFVLDFFNATWVRDTLIASEEKVLGTRRVSITRKISEDNRFVVKEIHLVDDGRSFLERVRLFDVEDLSAMITAAGMDIGVICGDYYGAEYTRNSPRTIFVARRP
ncbi:MAG: class I SAM-dependent methyltransferase [Gemmatimonadota bacterium]|nr:class I SAM-dependent methyltransferase [Gemmatimonadota bacterium]